MKLIHSNLDFSNIVMMVQKEVGDRFCTDPGSREYGSITALLHYYFDVKKEFLVSKKQFVPEPKVDSVVVSFRSKKAREFIENIDFFETILHDSFQYKRKTIRNNLKKYDLKIVEEVLKKYGFDLNVRAENLNYDIFVDLSNRLWK